MDLEILDRARDAAAELLPAFQVLAAYAYGSRVSGDFRPDSDLDVGYYLRGYREGGRLSLGDELLLAERLSERVGVEVDFRDVSRAPLEIRGALLEEGVRRVSSISGGVETLVVVPPKVVQLLEHLALCVRALERLAALTPDELLVDRQGGKRKVPFRRCDRGMHRHWQPRDCCGWLPRPA